MSTIKLKQCPECKETRFHIHMCTKCKKEVCEECAKFCGDDEYLDVYCEKCFDECV